MSIRTFFGSSGTFRNIVLLVAVDAWGCQSGDEPTKVSRAALVAEGPAGRPAEDEGTGLSEAKTRLRETTDPEEIARLIALTSAIAKSKAIRITASAGGDGTDSLARVAQRRNLPSASAWRQYALAVKGLDPNDPEDAARILSEKDRLIGGDK